MEKHIQTLENYLQEHYSPTAINGYLSRIARYKNANPRHKNGSLQEILHYLKTLRATGVHPKTVHNHLHSIKIYYDYLLATNQSKTHPCKALQLKDKIDKSIKTEQLYSKEQLQNFLDKTPEYKKVMVGLLVYQGLNTSELCSIKISDINVETAELQVKERTLPLVAKQIIGMVKHLEQCKPGQAYLFINRYGKPYRTNEINGYINYGRAAKDQITPLKIRQSVIKNLLHKSDLRIVQVFAGHKVSHTTQQYRTSDFEELRTAIEQSHPLNQSQ